MANELALNDGNDIRQTEWMVEIISWLILVIGLHLCALKTYCHEIPAQNNPAVRYDFFIW